MSYLLALILSAISNLTIYDYLKTNKVQIRKYFCSLCQHYYPWYYHLTYHSQCLCSNKCNTTHIYNLIFHLIINWLITQLFISPVSIVVYNLFSSLLISMAIIDYYTQTVATYQIILLFGFCFLLSENLTFSRIIINLALVALPLVILYFINKKYIGLADILSIAALGIVFSSTQLSLCIFIAALIALVYLLITKKLENVIPFIPGLVTSCFMIIYLVPLLHLDIGI